MQIFTNRMRLQHYLSNKSRIFFEQGTMVNGTLIGSCIKVIADGETCLYGEDDASKSNYLFSLLNLISYKLKGLNKQCSLLFDDGTQITLPNDELPNTLASANLMGVCTQQTYKNGVVYKEEVSNSLPLTLITLAKFLNGHLVFTSLTGSIIRYTPRNVIEISSGVSKSYSRLDAPLPPMTPSVYLERGEGMSNVTSQ